MILVLGAFTILSTALGCSKALENDATISQKTKKTADRMEAASAPNILLIVVDDLGFSDLGAFGGEIETPNLDALALKGVRLTDFHTAPTCSPTRAMLMTGLDNHIVGLGTMAEAIPPGTVPRPGYEGVLNFQARTIASIFRDAGYATSIAGKWHLGKSPELRPAARGFEQSYALLDGGGSHFGELSGTGAYNTPHMRENYSENGKLVTNSPGKFTADEFTDRVIKYITSAEQDNRPFFSFLAFTEPHWPLQAPEGLIEKYRGRYDSGPLALRNSRLERIRELKLLPNFEPHPMLQTPVWENLTAEDRAISSRAMEIYAAMIDSVDQNIGRIVSHLKDSGSLENTIIVFMSDNGPDGTTTEALLAAIQAHTLDSAEVNVDNSLENMGKANSFIAYGPDWAQAGSTPFNRTKIYPTEGGTRVAAFITGPGIPIGRTNNSFLHVTDVLPTLAELTNINSSSKDVTPALQAIGKSFVKSLWNENLYVHQDEPIGTELVFGGSLRLNDWKIVRLPVASPFAPLGDPSPEWRLYDLANDPGEINDLSETYPDKLKSLMRHWATYLDNNNVQQLPAPPPQNPH